MQTLETHTKQGRRIEGRLRNPWKGSNTDARRECAQMRVVPDSGATLPKRRRELAHVAAGAVRRPALSKNIWWWYVRCWFALVGFVAARPVDILVVLLICVGGCSLVVVCMAAGVL